MPDDDSVQKQLDSLKNQSKRTNDALRKIASSISQINERLTVVEGKLVKEDAKEMDEQEIQPIIEQVEVSPPNKGSSGLGTVLVVIGAVLTMTGLLAIIGIPLLIWGIVLLSRKNTETSQTKEQVITNEDNTEEEIDVSDEIEEKKVKDKSEKKKDVSLEEDLGIKWFARIGILALVIGIGFFIKYAVDMGWINHLARILMGVGLGIGLVLLGRKLSLNENYELFGKTLVGGGIAITYFATYAAYHFTEYREAIEMNLATNIILLSLIVIFAIIWSLRDDSKIIATEAFFLGYITALLSNTFGVLTLVYALLLTFGLIYVSTYKKWDVIGIGGILATYFIYLSWYVQNSKEFIPALIFLTIYFVAFSVQTSIIARFQKENNSAIFSLILNSVLFFLLGYSIISSNHNDYSSMFTFVLFLINLGLFLYYKFATRIDLAHTSLYLSLFFIAITIPLQINSAYITLVWAMLALVLFVIYKNSKILPLKYGGLIISIIAFSKTIFIDSWILQRFDSMNLLESTRLWSFIVTIICFYAISHVLLREREGNNQEDTLFSSMYSWFALGLGIFLLFLELYPKNSLWITIILAMLSVILIFSSKMINKTLLYQSYVISMLLAAKLVMHDLISMKYFLFANILESERMLAFLAGILAFYLISKYLYKNDNLMAEANKSIKELYSYAGTGLLFLLLLTEMKEFYISLGWSILALSLIIIGFIYGNKALRTQGIIIFSITILKVFLIDTRNLETIFRTLSYITLGAILLLVSFLYSKYKDKIREIL